MDLERSSRAAHIEGASNQPGVEQAQRYSDLPPNYHRWKWRVLLAFAFFYLFLYLGRFNFWPVSPIVRDELALSHVEIGQ